MGMEILAFLLTKARQQREVLDLRPVGLLPGTAAPTRAGHPHSGGTHKRDAGSLRAGWLQGPNVERGPVCSLLCPKPTSQAAQASREQRGRGTARRGARKSRG